MPTPTRAAKRPAPKAAAAAKPAARKPASKKPAPTTAVAKPRKPGAKASAATGDAASLMDLAKRLGKLELAGLAGKLVQGWRADLAAISEASRKSYAGLQAMVNRQTTLIKETAGELKTVGTVMAAVGPKESLRHLDDLARASLELALADIRELAAMAANSQREAFDIVHRRVTENIDEVQSLLRK